MSKDKTQTISKVHFMIKDEEHTILLDEEMGRKLDLADGLPLKWANNPILFGGRQLVLSDTLENTKMFIPPHKIDLVTFHRTTVTKAERGFLKSVHTKDKSL